MTASVRARAQESLRSCQPHSLRLDRHFRQLGKIVASPQTRIASSQFKVRLSIRVMGCFVYQKQPCIMIATHYKRCTMIVMPAQSAPFGENHSLYSS